MAHPAYLDQPFVKQPPSSPNEDVCFETGEVIYENKAASEINKMVHYTMLYGLFFNLFYLPFNYVYKASGPVNMMLDGINLPYNDIIYGLGDTYGIGNLIYILSYYVLGSLSMKFTTNILKPYVTKIQYNKTKDLIFVTRNDVFEFSQGSI